MRIFLEREGGERGRREGRREGEERGEEGEGGRRGRKEMQEGEGGRRDGGGSVSIKRGGSTLHTYLQAWIIVVTTSCIGLTLVSKDLLYQTTGTFLAGYVYPNQSVSQKKNHFPW